MASAVGAPPIRIQISDQIHSMFIHRGEKFCVEGHFLVLRFLITVRA